MPSRPARRARARVPAAVLAFIRGQHPDTRRKIRAAVEAVQADPALGRELRKELAGLRSLRVGRLRLIYRATSEVIAVVYVGPRTTVYEEAARLLAERGDVRKGRRLPE